MSEIAWAAGFFDGEGTTCSAKRGAAIQLSVAQVERQPLERFVRAVGERVDAIAVHPPIGPISRLPIHRFRVYGDRALAVVARLWSHLCQPKQDQALRAALAYAWRSVGHGGRATTCARGHSLTSAYVAPDGGRECAECRNLRRRGSLPRARISAIEARLICRQYVPAPIHARAIERELALET